MARKQPVIALRSMSSVVRRTGSQPTAGSGPGRTATIREVAERAGVSTATVSRVLSGDPVVAADTRQTVLEAVAALRYAPNAAARNLRTLRSRKLLVTVPDIANAFFAVILQSIENAALRAGYAVLLGDTQHDPKREDRYAQMLLTREADGLIFLGHRLPSAIAHLVRASAPDRAPIVNACEFSPSLGVPSVHIDNVKAGSDAVDHLCGLGHRRLAVITGPLESPLSRDRLKGVQKSAKGHGVERQLVVIHGDFSVRSGISGGDQLLGQKKRPTAVFCFSDEMALGVLRASRERGLRVPEDLSVMGFDDMRFAQYAEPPLTTIRQPMQEIGEEAVRLLLRILNRELSEAVSVTLPHDLVVRLSTAPPAGRPTGAA
jgi:LacI family transcriptional regulator, repressor for deo operon, udp, cdd, tsx, nupC, and nupG